MAYNTDRNIALKRKKLWDRFEWSYPGIFFLSKNNSLKCGCAWCLIDSYQKKVSNKKRRQEERNIILNDLNIN